MTIDTTARNPGHFCRFFKCDLDGTTVVHIEGPLDWASAPELRDLLAAADGEPKVIIDITGATSVDSAGTAVVLTAIWRRHAGGQRVALVAGPGTELDVLRGFGVSGQVPMCASVALAAGALSD